MHTSAKIMGSAIVMVEGVDNVAVAKRYIEKDSFLRICNNVVKVLNPVKIGSCFALSDIKAGDYVKQYGYPFGSSKGIKKGELITSLNVDTISNAYMPDYFVEPKKTVYNEEYTERTFLGFAREGGLVGTRNYYIIVPASMCVSETAVQIARAFDNDLLTKEYLCLDGVVALANTEGCGCDSTSQIDRFLTVLRGYILHPNVAACLIIDLGCEQTNKERLLACFADIVEGRKKIIDWVTVQSCGGTGASIEESKKIIKSRLKAVNDVERQPFPVEKLIVGTECGASDSFSGITANPLIGNVIDKVIYGKGSAILSEIPEMIRTCEMLYPRFRRKELFEKFKGLICWYRKIAQRLDLSLEANLVPKNIEGGLINNQIKSFGAAMKGGTTAIEDIIEYAEAVKTRGLSIMQGPGGDLESVTGMVASGATVICFSTGYGAISGNVICPVIKISSNDDTYSKMKEDIDFNAGRLFLEGVDIDTLGNELFEKLLLVASGEKTCSEHGKQRQFQVWTAGKLSL